MNQEQKEKMEVRLRRAMVDQIIDEAQEDPEFYEVLKAAYEQTGQTPPDAETLKSLLYDKFGISSEDFNKINEDYEKINPKPEATTLWI